MDKQQLKKIISSDLYRYNGKISKKKLIKLFFSNPGFRYTYLLRKCKFHKQNKNFGLRFLIFKVFLKNYSIKYGYEISEETTIGNGLYINHMGGIVVNSEAIIGNNVNLTTGVVIGQTNRGIKKGVPEIGNKVWIGAHSVIVGKIKIGNNVLIAPNSFVNFDVPDDSIVIGNPASIKYKEDATEQYIVNLI
ncbi:serine acetyltransferase [Aerococcus urinaeequi]|uniref:Serine acetyltransferase n=1 Tax=Aerococcus urinaeequi TaxID=51665 RepID=A0AA47J104_9LACT|nr:serine acetyltransferase [Aerococcus urinaeequi]WAT23977.1 serine acetyltransferase [Aerococcus urinaeequi]